MNGKPDASTGSDLPTQILLGQIPLLLKPDAQTVLVIGLGSGITAGSVLRHPVERLDIVEISEEVVEASVLPFTWSLIIWLPLPRVTDTVMFAPSL